MGGSANKIGALFFVTSYIKDSNVGEKRRDSQDREELQFGIRARKIHRTQKYSKSVDRIRWVVQDQDGRVEDKASNIKRLGG